LQYPIKGISKLFCLRALKAFTQHQGSDILRNVVVSGYVTFDQINKFFVKNSFIIDKKSLLVGFGDLCPETSQLTDYRKYLVTIVTSACE